MKMMILMAFLTSKQLVSWPSTVRSEPICPSKGRTWSLRNLDYHLKRLACDHIVHLTIHGTGRRLQLPSHSVMGAVVLRRINKYQQYINKNSYDRLII